MLRRDVTKIQNKSRDVGSSIMNCQSPYICWYFMVVQEPGVVLVLEAVVLEVALVPEE
jgi:hypothetical protein